jgi:geranylgeranyl diphosphate synthase, type I
MHETGDDMTSYTDVLDSLGGTIEDDLRKLMGEQMNAGLEYHPFIGDVYRAAGEFVLRGGRRLGSCSTLIVYRGYAGSVDERIVRACCGVELYRHSILVHDDVVDRDSLRRGGKTMHRLLEGRSGERFGAGSAIFAGNMLYSMAVEAVLHSGFDRARTAAALDLIFSDYRDVNESQILDTLFEYKEPDVDEWTVMAGKRAASLFRMSMLTGAILAGAPKGDLALLEDAARHIGYAFDIQDDIIDTFATEEQYGRAPCGDITKRKKPLHIILALQKDRRLASMMDKNDLDHADIEAVKDIIRGCGALDEAKSISRGHAGEAARLIGMTGMDDQSKGFFASFISYVAESLDWYQ